MTDLELQRRNLVAALDYGLISWFDYFRLWLELHKEGEQSEESELLDV